MLTNSTGISPGISAASYSPRQPDTEATRHPDDPQKTEQSGERPEDGNERFSVEEKRVIEKLKARDAEVRTHEQAHLNAAAGIAVSGASYTFQTGPDGVRYAIGGEVSIDTSPVPGNPEATIRKAEQIRRAALAPAQPSPQDYKVASQATAMAADARIELLKAVQNGTDSHDKGRTIDVTA